MQCLSMYPRNAVLPPLVPPPPFHRKVVLAPTEFAPMVVVSCMEMKVKESFSRVAPKLGPLRVKVSKPVLLPASTTKFVTSSFTSKTLQSVG